MMTERTLLQPYQSLALLTDFYQLTMAYAYWKSGLQDREAVFHLFFRKKPYNGGFTIAAGLQAVVEFIQQFRFDPSDIDYLAGLSNSEGVPLFEKEFLNYLSELQFTVDVDAVAEGTVVFPFEPLIRVQGPLLQCQLLESPLLNLINFPTLIATKAARICMAAKDDEVLEFGMRRAQGIDGAMTASRAAYIGGCHATSNVLAGKLWKIPVRGTHAHSWVMSFDDEDSAFYTYAKAMPDNCVFLIDTYDTLEGLKKAIEVGVWLRNQGKRMIGVRLDSGDLAYLSIQARKMLDAAGFSDAQIIASNELDEQIIADLKGQGAKITQWGVGTHLVTGKDQPALDGVYKMSALRDAEGNWIYKMKLSEQMQKISNPGILQVRRYYSDQENVADVVYDVHTNIDDGCLIVDPLDLTRRKRLASDLRYKDLLKPVFRKGALVYALPSLEEIRHLVKKELGLFHSGIKRLTHPHVYPVGMEKSLYDLKIKMIETLRKHD
jgi:nicotinate phosphoribosyltransferase